MAWTIKFTRTFQKEVQKLDQPIQRKVKNFFKELESCENPRSKGNR